MRGTRRSSATAPAISATCRGPTRDFVKSAAAHSTLTVDRREFTHGRRFVYGSSLIARGAGAGWKAILGKNPLLRRQDVEHRRLFLYKPGVALVVADRVRSATAHSYDRYFQLGPDIGISAQGSRTLGLQASEFNGTLYSESSAGTESRLTFRGRSDPL